MIGFDTTRGTFSFLPAGADWVLLAALVAYSGCGGITNMALSNWARDRGYGMGERVGYIPAAVGGTKVNLAHSGFMFPPTPPISRAIAAGGASSAPISGACSSWAASSAWCCRRCST